MATANEFRIGLDPEGTVHLQAVFSSQGPDDLNFKWDAGGAP